MNTMMILHLFVLIIVCMLQRNSVCNMAVPENNILYEFEETDLQGNKISMVDYKDSVLLIVNVSAKWDSFKNHRMYKDLNDLHELYSEKGLKILAFPCCQFESENCDCSDDYKKSVQDNKVQYSIFKQVNVNGHHSDSIVNSQSPIWAYLQKNNGGKINSDYTVFIIDRREKSIERIDLYYFNKISFIQRDIKKHLEKYFENKEVNNNENCK